MFAVCPTCERFLGRRSPIEQSDVVEEVCASCLGRPVTLGSPVVVVSRLRADTLEILRALLKVAPDFQVVIDRRSDERASRPPALLARGSRLHSCGRLRKEGKEASDGPTRGEAFLAADPGLMQELQKGAGSEQTERRAKVYWDERVNARHPKAMIVGTTLEIEMATEVRAQCDLK